MQTPSQLADNGHTFATLLRALRVARGLTQAKLAAHAECSVEAVRKYEAAARRPSVEVGERLSQALALSGEQRAAFLALARGITLAPEAVQTVPVAAVPDGLQPGTPAMLTFARTKLLPPRSHGTIPRPRLLAVLRQACRDGRLVVISAPAGAGKTTLLSTFAAAINCPVAWISIDHEDNQVQRLLVVLSTAIDQIAPEASRAARALLGSGATLWGDQQTFAFACIDALVNGLLAAGTTPAALILDDLQELSDELACASIARLVERRPAHVSLVLATRYDLPLPLARLRAHQQLVELRMADLRFTTDETAALLNEERGLALPREAVQALTLRTEGWAAGICLFANSTEQLVPSGTSKRSTGAFGATERTMVDYLTEEVLNRQEPALRAFLLETAVLPELTPAACRAVTGRADAALVLEELYRRNLFVVALDSAPSGKSSSGNDLAYRYHDLFRDCLRMRLQREAPERVLELHRRAADAETLPLRRLQHLLAAHAWAAAAALIEQFAEELLPLDQAGAITPYIDALPQEVQFERPRLLVLKGVAAAAQREIGAARTWLEQAVAELGDDPDATWRRTALAALALTYSRAGNFAAAQRTVEQALQLVLPQHLQVQLLLGQAHQRMGSGDWQAAVATLDSVLAVAEAQPGAQALAQLAVGFEAAYSALPGGLQLTRRLCTLLEHKAPTSQPLFKAFALMQHTWVLMWRGHWHEALRVGEQASDVYVVAGSPLNLVLELHVPLAILYALRGQNRQCDASFEQIFRVLETDDEAVQVWQGAYLFVLGRVRWSQGRYQEAEASHQKMLAVADRNEWPGIAGIRAHLAALLLLSEGRAEAAIEQAQFALALQERFRFTLALGDAQILLAAALLGVGRQEAALATFSAVLARCAADDTPGMIACQGAALVAPLLHLAIKHNDRGALARHMLSLLSAPMSAADSQLISIAETGAKLTEREIEVLRLLATGATSRTIGAQLVISPHTVKRHVANLYAKLGASTRAEAALRAQALGLV
jgi:LuxR family maltose regulon positive regulatory protein